ncbi:MAG: EAL domain-containing protein [Alphaproteobacteria bacterium]|nr:EAL domain-containing protein [Alphaproteobacteria bacterium]
MQQNLIYLFEKWLYPGKLEKLILFSLITFLLTISLYIVIYTGGTSFSYLHLFYVPIVLSGVFFALKGGTFIAIMSGFLVGPYMPLIISDHTMQPTHSWIVRTIFFILIGIISGLGSTVFRAYLREIKEKYLHNPVTHLPNFLGLEVEFENKKKSAKSIAIVLLDLKNLNEIEIAIGPAGIDKLLVFIKDDLINGLPKNVTIGHTQTSVFSLLIEDIRLADEIITTCKECLRSTYMVDDIPIFIEDFYGVSRYPLNDSTFSGLFRKARMAINYASKQAKTIAYYDPSVIDPSADNVIMLTQLNEAIHQGQLHIHYQPKIELKTGKIHGVEALARWRHPERGDISPAQFIPLTERTMLINPFTKWMLEQTFKDMARWESRGIELNLAVNFSLRNFHDYTIISKISELIEKYALNPQGIEIEVTETAFSTNMEEVIETLNYLRSLGLRISIDDFGTGQASQQYLFQLPIDGLKIDRIFVNELGINSAAQAIVKSAVSLAHQLNLTVVAEGIETQNQLNILKKMGCDLGQGYLMSAGMPFDELMTWIDQYTPPSPDLS